MRRLAYQPDARRGWFVRWPLAGAGMSEEGYSPAAHHKQPKIVVAKLWERKRPDGGSYFAGMLGTMKVLLTENRERTGPTDAGWVLIFQEEAPANKRPRNTGRD